jgi:hypothetical protein
MPEIASYWQAKGTEAPPAAQEPKIEMFLVGFLVAYYPAT